MKTKANRQRGMGLIIALLTLLLLSSLAAGLLMVTNTQVWTTVNYRLATQARYAAEYGAQQTAVWIANNDLGITDTAGLTTAFYPLQLNGKAVVLSAMSSVASNYPSAHSSVVSAFNSAFGGGNQSVPGLANFKYSTYATLLSMTPAPAAGAAMYQMTWQITSQATINGIRNAQVQVVENIQRMVGVPLYQYAIQSTGTTCNAIVLSGGAYTDSFDSNSGPYSSSKSTTGGNVESNGNVSLSGGGTHIEGNLYDPNANSGASCAAGSVDALNTGGGSSVTGTVSQISSAMNVPTPLAPTPAPPTTNESMSGSCGTVSGCTDDTSDLSSCPSGKTSLALAPGTYGNVSASGGTCIHLSAGTYNLNSLTLSGNSPIVVDSGPIYINVAGSGVSTPIDLSGGTLANAGGLASNLQISYGGTGNVDLSGGTGSYALVDAPNAAISFSGGSSWYGAVIGKTVNDSGGTAIHYDRSLIVVLTNGKFQVVGFNWSKF